MNNRKRDRLKTAMKMLEEASNIIDAVREEEEEALENLPENLQDSERYESMENNVERLQDSIESIEQLVESIGETL